MYARPGRIYNCHVSVRLFSCTAVARDPRLTNAAATGWSGLSTPGGAAAAPRPTEMGRTAAGQSAGRRSQQPPPTSRDSTQRDVGWYIIYARLGDVPTHNNNTIPRERRNVRGPARRKPRESREHQRIIRFLQAFWPVSTPFLITHVLTVRLERLLMLYF